MTVLMEMIGLEPRFEQKPASGTVGFAFSSHLLGASSVVGSSEVKQKDRHKTVLMEMIGLEPRFCSKNPPQGLSASPFPRTCSASLR